MSTLVTAPQDTASETGSKQHGARAKWLIGRTQAWLLLVAYAALVGVGSLIGTFITGLAPAHPLITADVSISEGLAERRTSTLNLLTDIGSGFSDTISVVVIIAVLSVIFAIAWRRWDEITLLATALLLEVTSFVSIAYVVGRERPPVEHLDPSPPTAGFPSGHTAAAVALYFGLASIVASRTDRRWASVVAYVGATIAALVVAASRMYRGMHFLTDVTIGAVLGAACLVVVLRVVNRQGKQEEVMS